MSESPLPTPAVTAATAMEKISAMIPPPPINKPAANASDDDDDNENDDDDWDWREKYKYNML